MFYIIRETNNGIGYIKSKEEIKDYLFELGNKLKFDSGLTRLSNIIIDEVKSDPPPTLTYYKKEKPEEKQEEKLEEKPKEKPKEKKPRVKLTVEQRQEKFNLEIQKLEERLKKKLEQYDKFQKREDKKKKVNL